MLGCIPALQRRESQNGAPPGGCESTPGPYPAFPTGPRLRRQTRIRNAAHCLLFGLGLLCLASADSAAQAPGLVKIGLLIPVEGASAIEGSRVENAARLAVAEANARAERWRFELTIAPSDLPWGAQTTELVRLIDAEGVPVIIGGLDSRSAHLAAQIVTRFKGRVLFVALTADPTLTQMGIPWIFRILPGEPGQAPMSPSCARLQKAFRARYYARYQEQPTPTAAFAYDAVRVTLDAVREAGVAPEKIGLSLMGGRRPGASGLIPSDESGDRVVTLDCVDSLQDSRP